MAPFNEPYIQSKPQDEYIEVTTEESTSKLKAGAGEMTQ